MQHPAPQFLKIQNKVKLAWITQFGNVMLGLFMATAMIHIFPSGNPQPADMMIALAVFVSAAHFSLSDRQKISNLSFIALLFGGYTLVINLIHFYFIPDIMFFKSSLYYIFNVSVMLFIIGLFRSAPAAAWRFVYWGLLFSVVIQFLYIEFIPNMRGYRNTGTFANPNQLALWSLTTACVLVVLCYQKKMKLLDYCGLAILAFIQTLALSKAGIICFLLLFASIILSKATSFTAKAVLLISFFLFALFALSSLEILASIRGNFENINKAASRLEKIGSEDDESLEGRNYTRITNNPQFILLGAGEGAYFRFEDSAKNLEIHSGLGTLVFSYGLVGTILFFWILLTIVRRTDWYVGFLIGLLLLYGLTHQIIRATHFWVFLGVAYGMRYVDREGGQYPLQFVAPEHN